MTINELQNALKIYIGATEVSSLHIGSTLVWQEQIGDGLPDGYTELEYISSTNNGNQYIDLGIKLYEVLNTDYDIAIKFIISSTNTEGLATMFNCQDPNNSPWPGTYIRKNNSGSNITGRYIGGSSKDNIIGQLDNIIELPVLTSPNKNVTNINNNNSTHLYGTGLFCSFSDTNNTPQRYCNGTLYYFKLFVSGTLVRDMIPCKNPNNVVGLYDLVNHRFYSSPNNNAFIAGPEIIKEVKFLDILYSDSNGNLSIDSQVLPTSEGKTPIALCIAGTEFFGVDEPARWMSLKYMKCGSPENGSLNTSSISMYWGNNGNDIDTITNIQTTYSNGSTTGYLTNYNPNNSNPKIPSLFDANNNWNTSVLGAANSYAVTDIDGKNKTAKILVTATSQSNWRTNSTITNNKNSGYAPPACCCYRYHTLGTNIGDWYLGACGEMCMIIAQKSEINEKLNDIHTLYPNNCISSLTSDQYWTSTEYSGDLAYIINFDTGIIEDGWKDNSRNTLALLRYDPYITLKAQLLDILYSDSNGNLNFTPEILPASANKVPIALCIAATGFFGANEPARWMALKFASNETPFTGKVEFGAKYGGYGTNLSMTDIQTTYNGGSSTGYLTDFNNPYYEDTRTPLIPSLFNANNEWNISVLGTINSYAVTDIDGKNKTDILLQSITQQPNWQTDNEILCEENSGYAGPAACCARYHTLGTQEGDWYLGSIGEMCMIIVNSQGIGDILGLLENIYGENVVKNNKIGNDTFITSTEYDSTRIYAFNPYSGYIDVIGKDSSGYVLPLLQY